VTNKLLLLASPPGPSPSEEAWYTPFCACAIYSVISSIKNFVHLCCPYAEDYTNQEYKAYFEIDSSGILTCKILLEYYFSDMPVLFLQNIHSNRKVKN